jgi:hypothetical protein
MHGKVKLREANALLSLAWVAAAAAIIESGLKDTQIIAYLCGIGILACAVRYWITPPTSIEEPRQPKPLA